MKSLPKRIDPCPIVEAVVEVRFSSLLPSEAIFGVAYSKVGSDFEKAEKLPILQVPEAIRSQDENLRYQGYYSLHRENLSLKIGPRVLTFSNVEPYSGWESFFPFIQQSMRKLSDSGIINVPERIGIRYINLFKYPLFGQINLDLTINEQHISTEPANIRAELQRDGFVVVLQIANNTGIKSVNYEGIGSLVDIDCIHDFGGGAADFPRVFEELAQAGHLIEKQSFFSLLTPDHLARLNPTY
jgi:uncharacterized protein (TIGR04255 family)